MFYKIRELASGLFVSSMDSNYLLASVSDKYTELLPTTLVKVGRVYQNRKPAETLCQRLNNETTKYKFEVVEI